MENRIDYWRAIVVSSAHRALVSQSVSACSAFSSKEGPMHRKLLPLILRGICAMSMPASPARACGGFFCTNVPVDQSAERIIFAVNEAAGTIDAYVQINYTGSPEQFAWVVPVPNPPKVDVADIAMIDELDGP